MAKKKKGRKITSGEQTVIAELAPEKIPEIHTAATRYQRIRDERCALSKKEKEANDFLMGVMDKHERTSYEFGDLEVFVDEKRKCSVTTKAADAEPSKNGESE